MGGSSKDQTTSVAVPSYLQPFMQQSADISSGALMSLQDQLSKPEAIVSPFNDLQNQGMQQATNFANSPELASMQSEMAKTADPSAAFGMANTGFQLLTNQDGRNNLREIGNSSNFNPATLNNFASTPSFNPEQLQGFSNRAGFDGGNLSGMSSSSGMNPNSRLNNFSGTSGLDQSTQNTLRNQAAGFTLNSTANNALTNSATGSGQFNTPGFKAAVDASIRAAAPQIASTFAGQGGSGAVSGGLAKTAMQQAASDSFAGLFDNERNRQMRSAEALGNLQIQGNEQAANAAKSLGGLSLQDRGLQQGAATSQDQMFLQDRSQQQTAASNLARLQQSDMQRRQGAVSDMARFGLADNSQRLGAATSAGQLGLQDASTRINAANSLNNADIQAGNSFVSAADSERTNQLNALRNMPQFNMTGANTLMNIGGMQQNQLDRQKMGGIDQMQMLMGNTFGGQGAGMLLGQTQPMNRNKGAGILGGAGTGAQLGSAFGPWGTAIGAVGGGLLGGMG